MHATLVPTVPADAPVAALERALVGADGAPVAVLRVTATAPAGTAWRVSRSYAGQAAGATPTVAQLTWFDGPRVPRWTTAFERSGDERLWPAVRDLPGIVDVLVLQAADGSAVVVASATSRAVLAEADRRIVATPLLPDEDVAQLTGPTRVEVLDVRTTVGAR